MSIDFMLTQTGALYVPTLAKTGNPRYSVTAETASVPCREERTTRQTQAPDGTTVITSSVIFVPGDTTVIENYKMIIDGYDYLVKFVDPIRDMTSISHKELLCQGF